MVFIDNCFRVFGDVCLFEVWRVEITGDDEGDDFCVFFGVGGGR